MWKNLDIVIYDENPMISSKIQEAIVETIPSLEVNIESFENYDDAYKYCHDLKSVGLLIMSDQSHHYQIKDIATELSLPFKNTMPAPLIVLYYVDDHSLEGARLHSQLEEVKFYINLEKLLLPNSIEVFVPKVLEAFIDANIDALFGGVGLQESVLEIYQNHRDNVYYNLRSKILLLLKMNADVGWIDRIVLDWYFQVQLVNSIDRSVLKKNVGLVRLIESYDISFDDQDLKVISETSDSLILCILKISQSLFLQSQSPKFESHFSSFIQTLSLRDKFILRVLKRNYAEIIKEYRNVYNNIKRAA